MQRRDDTKQSAKNPRDQETMAAYITKIVLAFVFIFLLGGLFTYLLETLPDMFQPASEPQPL
jgi:cell division septal protein FtsQ